MLGEVLHQMQRIADALLHSDAEFQPFLQAVGLDKVLVNQLWTFYS